MLVRLRKILLICLLLAATGGQTALLQCVAWTSMLAGNLRTTSVSQAVQNTFDGNHPCPLCQAIARAKSTEKKSEATVPATRLEFLPLSCPFLVKNTANFERVPVAGEFADTRTCKPSIPPPRA